MKMAEAKRIIRRLADGADPETGEIFPANSPYQHPQIIRSLFLAVEALDRQGKSKNSDSSHSKAGSLWTEEEEAQLINEFDSGIIIEDLAKLHYRTPGAITARLEKLGKIEPESSEDSEAG